MTRPPTADGERVINHEPFQPAPFSSDLSAVLVRGDHAPQLFVGMVRLDGEISGPHRERSCRSGEPIWVVGNRLDAAYFETEHLPLGTQGGHHAHFWAFLAGLF